MIWHLELEAAVPQGKSKSSVLMERAHFCILPYYADLTSRLSISIHSRLLNIPKGNLSEKPALGLCVADLQCSSKAPCRETEREAGPTVGIHPQHPQP